MGQDPIGTSVDIFPCLAAFVSVVLALALSELVQSFRSK